MYSVITPAAHAQFLSWSLTMVLGHRRSKVWTRAETRRKPRVGSKILPQLHRSSELVPVPFWDPGADLSPMTSRVAPCSGLI